MMGKHIIEYADFRHESFAHVLASSSGGGVPSKRFLVVCVLEPPDMQYNVSVGGESQYKGNSLKLAIETYNQFD